MSTLADRPRAEATEATGADRANRMYDERHPHGRPLDPHSLIPTLSGASEDRIVKVAAVALVVPINGFSTRESTLQRVLYYLLGL